MGRWKPLLQIAAHSGSPEWQLPIGVVRDDLIVAMCTGYEVPIPTPEDSIPHLPGHLYTVGSAGHVNTLDGPKPLTWMGYLWVPLNVTSLAGVGSYHFSMTAELHLGGIPFLQRSVQLVCYRNVRDIAAGSGVADENEYDPEGHDYGNPWTAGSAPSEPVATFDSAVLGIATSNGTVAGHAGGDTTGQWTSRGFDQGGRKSVAQFTWVTPGDGIDPDAKVPRPDGEFPLSGTRPSSYSVGTGLIRKTIDQPPVVRQYPRDSRGLAAASRIYPPPRSGRVVGGHQ